jgi:endonuclease/exonuclease/phosphatase family metal-dependent hydrolase
LSIFRIATFNTGQAGLDLLGMRLRDGVPFATERLPAIADAIARNSDRIDVWLLQEVYGKAAMSAVSAIPSYQAFMAQSRPRNQATGLAILVREDWPAQLLGKDRFAALDRIEKSIANKGIMAVGVETPDGPIAFGNLHTCYDGRGDQEARKKAPILRRRQLEKAAAFMSRHNGDTPAILGGDFNLSLQGEPGNHAVLTSKGWRDLRQNAVAHEGGSLATWSASNPIVTPDPDYPDQDIDLLFATGNPDWQYSTRTIFTENIVDSPDGRQVPLSDHYGLMAEVSLP